VKDDLTAADIIGLEKWLDQLFRRLTTDDKPVTVVNSRRAGWVAIQAADGATVALIGPETLRAIAHLQISEGLKQRKATAPIADAPEVPL